MPKLWVHDPLVLVEQPSLRPSLSMSKEELINTFTCIVIVIFFVFLILAYTVGLVSYLTAFIFLIVGLVVMAVIGVALCGREPEARIENFSRTHNSNLRYTCRGGVCVQEPQPPSLPRRRNIHSKY